jgi:hypothetical protein
VLIVRVDPAATADEVYAIDEIVEGWVTEPDLLELAEDAREVVAWQFAIEIAWCHFDRRGLEDLTARFEASPGVRVLSYAVDTDRSVPREVLEYLSVIRHR